jgi:hypothetical protein
VDPRFRGRIGRVLVLVAVVAVYFTLAPRWPKDNVVHVVLGIAAPEVTEMHLRYAAAPKNGPMAEDWTREVTFSFPEGTAPRVVTHEPRLADGDYVVEIEILKASHAIVRVKRRVTLEGGTTSIDVSEAVAIAGTPAIRVTPEAPEAGTPTPGASGTR